MTGKASETYKKVLEEVHEISRASLFTPVTRHEAVQAMSKYLCYAGISAANLIFHSTCVWLVRQRVVKWRPRCTYGNGNV
jgi:hypothetical protein